MLESALPERYWLPLRKRKKSLSVEKINHVLSSIVFYDHDEAKVSFDQITLEEYAGRPDPTVLPADGVAAAIDAAVRITLDAWNGNVWTELTEVLG